MMYTKPYKMLLMFTFILFTLKTSVFSHFAFLQPLRIPVSSMTFLLLFRDLRKFLILGRFLTSNDISVRC
jgi:hypothetical protein